MAEDKKEVRIDKWLWAARFFKTRSLAAQAVNGGHVHLNGNRVKAAKNVIVGDEMVITVGSFEFHITVLVLSERRGPATQARLLYVESEESIKKREEQREMRKMANAGFTSPEGKPDKHDRRKIREFLRKNR